MLTWLPEGCGPHLCERADDLAEVMNVDHALALLIQEVEALPQLLLLRAVHQDVQVVQIFIESDLEGGYKLLGGVT